VDDIAKLLLLTLLTYPFWMSYFACWWNNTNKG